MGRSSSSTFLVSSTLGAIAALAGLTQGCATLLGDFSVNPGADASTGNGQDDASPDDGAALGDAGPADGPAVGSHPDATSPDGGPSTGGGKEAGPGSEAGPSGDAGPSDGGGGGICTPGSSQCSADGGVQDCVGGNWTAPVACSNSVCSMGQCTGTCSPNTTQCSGNSVQRCDSTGHLGTPGPCVSQACVGGVCQGVCVPGTTRCGDGGTETCGMGGSWGSTAACGAHQACTGGGTTTATCACQTTNGCTGTGTICTDSADLASCTQDSQGCWYPSTPSACSNGACFGAAGSASCCTNQCTANATKCGGAGVQTCQTQGNGCTAYNAGSACGTHQTCTGTAPNAQCTCTADPTCTSASNVCTGTTLTTCAADTQSCFYAVSSSSCGANEQCSMNACACKSGFTPCSSACVDTLTDVHNCGACGHACPTVTSPSAMACVDGTCTGYIGGYIASTTPTTAAAVNPDGMSDTVAAVKATMPAVGGTFQGFGVVLGSTAASGNTTAVVMGLYSDSGGMPNAALIDTDNSTVDYNDPSALMTVTPGGYITRQTGGFNSSLPANSTYWVYVFTQGQQADTVGVSTAQTICLTGWRNFQSPISWSYGGTLTACSDYEAWMVVTFP